MGIDLQKILNNPLANKLSALADFSNFASNALNNYLVIPNNKEQALGIGGFLFDIPEDDRVEFSSDITDHYVEDNTAVQDHIALRPETITVRGYVGELKAEAPSTIAETASEVQKLQTLAPFLPALTSQAQLVYNEFERVYRSYERANDTAQNIYNNFKNIPAAQQLNKQQQAFNFFYLAWQNRQLFTVQTPFVVFDSCAIMSVSAVQDKETRFISDFTITFKKLRIGSTIQSVSKVTAGRAKPQSDTQIDKGIKKPLISMLQEQRYAIFGKPAGR